MKRLLSALLLFAVLLMSAGVLLSCGDTDGPPSGETAAAGTEAAETTAEETTLYMPDDLPDTLDFGGRTVTTFGWSGSAFDEFYAEEQNGEVVNDAIYTRNLAVSERLNVNLEYRLEPGANPDRAGWVKAVTASVMAGDAAYDICAGYSMSGANLAAAGMLTDVGTVDHLDLSKPWWPDSLTKEATVNGHLYFASGDISTRMLYYMMCVFFNKSLAESFNIGNLYDLVLDGTWTLDKMVELSSGVYSDLNGDGVKGIDDRYGLLCHITYSDSLYFGAGLSTTTVGDDGLPAISEDFKGERAQSLLEKLVGIFNREDCFLLIEAKVSDSYNVGRNMFTAGNILFTVNECGTAQSSYRNSEIAYSILPIPKGSESQENYRTCMSFPYSLYGIPIDASDPDLSGAVMECLASEGYRPVSPALFEIAMKVKYSDDPEAAAMYDIIRGTVNFDFGRIFNNSLGSMTYSLFRSSVQNGTTDWASTYAKNAEKLQNQLDALLASLTAGN